jgi:hypothetical protein
MILATHEPYPGVFPSRHLPRLQAEAREQYAGILATMES